MKKKNAKNKVSKKLKKPKQGGLAKKIGVGVGLLASVIGSYFISPKQANAQDITALPREYVDNRGHITLKASAFTDRNIGPIQEKWYHDFRSQFGIDGLYKFKTDEDLETKLFFNVEAMGPGIDVSTSTSFLLGGQVAYDFLGPIFASLALAYQNQDFDVNDANHAKVTYIDENIDQFLGRIAVGFNDAKNTGLFGSFAFEPKLNCISDKEYNKDKLDWNTQTHVEYFLKDGSIYLRWVHKENNSHEYFVCDVEKLIEDIWEGGFDYMAGENFGFGASVYGKNIRGHTNNTKVTDEAVYGLKLRIYFPIELDIGNGLPVTPFINFVYESSGKNIEDELMISTGLRISLGKYNTTHKCDNEPKGKVYLPNSGPSIGFKETQKSLPKQNYIPSKKPIKHGWTKN